MSWIKISALNNYSVSDTGEVRNDKTSKKLRLINRNGYKAVHLYNNGLRVTKSVHRLVAEAFIPNPDNKPQVNHIDGNKQNNNVNNLEWVTVQENNLHAYRVLNSSEARNKISLSKVGKKRSEDTKRKISETKKGKYTLSESPRARRVIRLEDGKIYDCIIEAARDSNANRYAISSVCSGSRKTAGGYHWSYAKEA